MRKKTEEVSAYIDQGKDLEVLNSGKNLEA